MRIESLRSSNDAILNHVLGLFTSRASRYFDANPLLPVTQLPFELPSL